MDKISEGALTNGLILVGPPGPSGPLVIFYPVHPLATPLFPSPYCIYILNGFLVGWFLFVLFSAFFFFFSFFLFFVCVFVCL